MCLLTYDPHNFFFYRAEAAALNESERTAFANFCEVLGRQLIPYLNRCLEAIFPSSALSIVQGSSSLTNTTTFRLDVKSLQLLLEPVMPQDTTQEEEKPHHEKEAETRHVVPQDVGQEMEKPLDETETASNQEKEREVVVSSEESPTEQQLQREIGEKIPETEQEKLDLT